MTTRVVAIPQTDPRASYIEHQSEIDEAIARVLQKGRYILGTEVELFEHEFAAAMGSSHAVGVANGTDALLLALRACGVGPGHLVFTVSHTAVATVAAIELTGATPVFVDIDGESLTMSPDALAEAMQSITSGIPKAVIPVHLYGNPAALRSIKDIADRHGMLLIEDCAQSHGALLEGRPTGTWGQIASFSFYPTKNLGALGDGGMVVTKDGHLAERVRLLRQYGWRDRYVSEVPGTNSRLDELQAAILRVKLRYLEADNERRRTIAARYRSSLPRDGFRLPAETNGSVHVYHQFVIRHQRRDALRAHFEAEGIGTLIHYPVPVHLQPAYEGRLECPGTLDQTERVAMEVVSLPMFPQLSDEQVDAVCESAARFVRTS